MRLQAPWWKLFRQSRACNWAIACGWSPDLASRASKLGLYNVDPSVVFWATPPVHGVLTPYVVHPPAFTYKLPDNVFFAEAAMV